MNLKLIRLSNVILFYIIWWGCVLGVKYSYNLLGLVLTLMVLAIHLKIVSLNSNYISELKLILYSGALGVIVESIHLYGGILNYNGYIFQESNFPPIWIICMWLGFATTLNYSMYWMKGKWFIMIIAGAVFGPLSYMAGVNLGTISFNFSNSFSCFFIALTWAISIPLLYILNEWIYE